jgi:hypothetical protein
LFVLLDSDVKIKMLLPKRTALQHTMQACWCMLSETDHLWTGNSGYISAILSAKSTKRSMDAKHRCRPCADGFSYSTIADCATSLTSTHPV